MIVVGGVEEVAGGGSTEEVFDIEFERAEAVAHPLPKDFLDTGVTLILMSSGLLSAEYASTPLRHPIG